MKSSAHLYNHIPAEQVLDCIQTQLQKGADIKDLVVFYEHGSRRFGVGHKDTFIKDGRPVSYN